MRRRSMATFMNAMTGSDFTCYPASSLIKKDFYNLLSIYIDAVFHPLLKKESFMQEAHRLEFMDPKDPHSPLIYKGVVYNEMKGAMSSPDARIYHKTMTNLMPDLPYAHNSGGEPKEIPSLTYQGLLEFHKYFYHPSNCLFFFYGNLPLEEHLDFIEKRALKNVSRTEPLLPLPKQKRFSSPVFPSGKYPLPAHIPTEKKTLVSLSFF